MHDAYHSLTETYAYEDIAHMHAPNSIPPCVSRIKYYCRWLSPASVPHHFRRFATRRSASIESYVVAITSVSRFVLRSLRSHKSPESLCAKDRQGKRNSELDKANEKEGRKKREKEKQPSECVVSLWFDCLDCAIPYI